MEYHKNEDVLIPMREPIKPKEYLRKVAELLDIPDKQMKIVMELLKNAEEETAKKIFEVFDEYACIKNDKWYKEIKKRFKEVLN